MVGSIIRWAVVLAGVVGAVLCWAGVVGADLAPPARASLGVTSLAVGLWGSELLALPVTAILAMTLLYVSGAVPRVETAFVGFGSPVLFFLLGSTALGIAAEHTGLADRLAGWLLVRSRGSGPRLLLELLLSLPLQAFLVPSAMSRNAVLVPVYDRVLARLGRPPKLGAASMLTLGVLGPLASSALLSGGTSPVAAAQSIGGFTWTSWLVALAPPYYVLLLVGGVAVWLFSRPEEVVVEEAVEESTADAVVRGGTPAASAAGVVDSAGAPGSAGAVERRHQAAGARAAGHRAHTAGPSVAGCRHHAARLSAGEWRVAAVSLATSALWVLDQLTHWPPAIPALLAMVVLLTPRVGVMGWREFAARAPWATGVVLAGAVSLADALSRSGAAAWMARGLFGWLPAAGNAATVALAVFVVTAIITLAIPNRAAAITLGIPLAAAYAASGPLSATAAGLVVLIAVDAETIYPAQTAANLIAYDRGYFSTGALARFNLITLAAAAAVIVFVALPWWGLVGLPGAR